MKPEDTAIFGDGAISMWTGDKAPRPLESDYTSDLLIQSEVDLVNRPPHYTAGAIESIDVIESWGLGFHLGNAIKYILRCGRKVGADPVQDLEKARWYIDREIQRRKRGGK